jgi:hypothetical protein
MLVVAFLIVQHIANNNDGKVFGVQIGFRNALLAPGTKWSTAPSISVPAA